MAQKHINTDIPNSGNGDALRDAFNKTEDNFNELYATKVDKISGKGLSTNDYTTAEKAKLAGIPADAEKNVQADFLVNDPSSDAYIKNKPNFVTSVNWGQIEGDIANQYDLQNALDQKTGFAYVDGKITQTITSGITDFSPSENAVFNGLEPKENKAEKNIPNGYAGLDAGGKILTSQLPNSVMEYKGVYNAATNTPTLVNGTGNTGDVYRVTVSGAGVNSLNFVVGDYVVYNGSTWEKQHSGSDNVVSVFGRAGVISAQTGDYTTAQVTETTNKNYQTDNQKLFNDATSSIQTQINSKEFAISTGLNTQYWRGDKSWQTLDKTAVGLGNVDNTTDSTKNVLSATKLTTARTINGVAFDGTANITINATDSIPRLALSGGTLTGGLTGTTGNFTGVLTAPTAPAGTNTTQVATTAYVQANSIGGTGAAGQVAFWNSTGTQTSTSRFLYDSSNNILTMNAVNGFFDVNRTTNGNQAAPNFENILRYGSSGFYSYIQGGNSFTSNQGTYLKFVVNSPTGTLQDALTIANNSTSTFAVGSANTFSPTTQADGTLSIGNAASGTFAPLIVGKSSNGVGMYLAGLANDANTSPDFAFNVRTTSNSDFSASAMTSTAYRFSRFGTVLLDILRNGNTLIGTTTSQTWINSDSSFGTSKLNLSATGGARVLEINREDTTVISGITGGGGMCLSTVPFANGVGGVFGNNVLGYMRNPLESVGIRGACVPLSDTGTEPIVKIEANSSTTNGFSGIKFVDTRPILGVYNYSSSLFRVMATGAVGMGAGLQSPNYNLHIHANANSNFLQMTSLISGTATTDGLILGIDTNSAVLFINRENTHIAFHTNNSEKMRVHASGGVSIGNTSDLGAGTLNVTGAVTAPTFNGALNGNASSASLLNAYSSQLALITSMDYAFARNGNNVIAPVGSAAFRTWLAISNVDNTSDANKPVSTATQTALNLRASLGGSNTFTGTNNFSGGIVVVADPVNAYHAVPKNYVDSNFQPKLTYKVYTATLNQTGTAAPVPTIMDNSIGSIIWTRTGIGTYSGTLSGAFTTGKTTVFLNPAFGTGNVNAAQWITSSRIDIKTLNGLTPTDGLLTTDIEIRVYS